MFIDLTRQGLNPQCTTFWSNLYQKLCYNIKNYSNGTPCLPSPTFTTEHVTLNIYVTGRVPMRHLVYRVQPLPQSMLPLVWDFGQLNTEVEEMYIRQMVRRYVCTSCVVN